MLWDTKNVSKQNTNVNWTFIKTVLYVRLFTGLWEAILTLQNGQTQFKILKVWLLWLYYMIFKCLSSLFFQKTYIYLSKFFEYINIEKFKQR